jgi:hypothetical protein
MFLVQGVRGIRDENVIRSPFADGKTALISGGLVGRAPVSAFEFARRHAAAFSPAVQSGPAQSPW